MQGVSVGAILSNYQRVRVEHVYVLQIPPSLYIVHTQQLPSSLPYTISLPLATRSSRIVVRDDRCRDGKRTHQSGRHRSNSKAPRKILERNARHPHAFGTSILSSSQKSLNFSQNSLYGLHVCGEGGEYESLTLDGPPFKYRIVLDETEVVMHTENDFAPVAYLRVKRASLHPKESFADKRVELPPLLEDKFLEIKDVADNTVVEVNSISEVNSVNCPGPMARCIPDRPLIRAMGSWLAIGNLYQRPSLDLEITLDHEVRNCFHQLQGIRIDSLTHPSR